MPLLRALKAKHGDSLLLLTDDATVLIDGGPSGVYRRVLRRGLAALPGAGIDPPRIDLLIVSHIDADHIDGILDLTDELLQAREEERKPIVKVEQAWHNSFADTIAKSAKVKASDVKLSAAGVADTFSQLAGESFNPHESKLVLSSVAQGRRLRLDLETLNVDLNKGFRENLVMRDTAPKPWTRGALTLKIVGPTMDEVGDLRETWAKELPKILRKEGLASMAAAAKLDRSVSNLASLVVVAEIGNKEALLTGDARGDMILKWLEDTGDLVPGGSRHFHIVKLPHHGSTHNVNSEFFERIRADHYVVSGNGGHGNPEPRMLEMLFTARPELNYEIHLTYGPEELKKSKAFTQAGNGPALDTVLSKADRRAIVKFPAAGKRSVDIPF